MNIARLHTTEEIKACLLLFDTSMTRAISSRIDIDIYAKKLHSYAYSYAAYADKETIGFVSVYANMGSIAYLNNIAVKKDYRKQGVGRLLLAKAEEVARYENMQEMQLEVDRANTAAITFYNSHGYMPNGKETEQSIYLRKQLV